MSVSDGLRVYVLPATHTWETWMEIQASDFSGLSLAVIDIWVEQATQKLEDLCLSVSLRVSVLFT